MKILSFDTGTRSIHTSLLEDETVVYSHVLEPSEGERQESATYLLPEIDRALKTAGWHKRQLDAVVVGAGPGSFTGIRVSMVVARSLGQGLDIGVIPVCFLDTVAASASVFPCAVVLPAGAGFLYAATYDSGPAGPKVELEPFCAPSSLVLERIGAQVPCITDLETAATIPSPATVLPWPQINNIATAGAVLALNRLSLIDRQAEELRHFVRCSYPWQSANPLYLRSPSVTLKSYGNSN